MGFVSQNEVLQQLRVQVSLHSEAWHSKAIFKVIGRKYYSTFANVE